MHFILACLLFCQGSAATGSKGGADQKVIRSCFDIKPEPEEKATPEGASGTVSSPNKAELLLASKYELH